MTRTYYAPGYVALVVLCNKYPNAGLDVTGLAVEVSDRGLPEQAKAAENEMQLWSFKEGGKLTLSDHNSS